MGYPTGSGHPDYSTHAAGGYIPQLWHPRILVRFYEKLTFSNISNTNYSDQIKKHGDTVNIRRYPDIDILDYVKGQVLKTQVPETSDVQLVVNKGKYFNVFVDDVDEVQSDIDLLNMYSETAGEQMAVKIDLTVMQGVYADASSYNIGATAGLKTGAFNLGASGAPLNLTRANIIETISKAARVLDEQSVPDDGQRYICLPPLFMHLLDTSDLRDASVNGGQKVMMGGFSGMVNNMRVFSTNQLYSATDGTDTAFYCLYGHPLAIGFAEQLVRSKVVDAVDRGFGSYVRGLNVFGYKVIKPEAFGYVYATYAGD